MNKTLVALVVTTLLGAAAPAVAARQDSLGRTVPDSTAEGWDGAAGRYSRDPVSSDAVGDMSLTQETFSQMGEKLDRGLMNVVTGWMELPKGISTTSQEWGPLGMILGSLQGLAVSTVRTLAGVYETATFPVPIPAGYAPVVLPTSVFTWEKGIYLRSPSW